MSKNTILIFIDWFTPGYKAGGPVRSNANLIAQGQDHFNFRVVTRNTEYMETIPYSGIQPDTWADGHGFKGYYFSKEGLSVRNLKNLIRETPCDCGYVNGIYSLYFSVLPVYYLKRYRKKVVISARGMLSPHALAVKGFRKKAFLFVARTLGLYNGVTFHATNDEEAGYIRNIIEKKASIHIAPNLPKPANLQSGEKTKLPGEAKLIYIGRVAPEKNTLFAIESLKEFGNKQPDFDQAQPPASAMLSHRTSNFEPRTSNLQPPTSNLQPPTSNLKPQITLSIYGSIYDTAYWNECEKLIAQLPENIQVHYHGSVEPEKISEILAQHHFLFQPSKGENYGHTIAESFQNGTPVIISDRTPWRGLQAVDNIQSKVDSREAIVDSSPSEYIISPDSPTSNLQPRTLNLEPRTSNLEPHPPISIGWDLPLEHPEQFVEVLEYCARMGHDEYNAMSQRAFLYAQSVFNDQAVLEANWKLFGK